MRIETDVKRVQQFAKAREDDYWRFRSFLKRSDLSVEELDAIVHHHYQDVSQQIDCCSCGNCCTKVTPRLSPDDVTRLSAFLGLSPGELTVAHLRPTGYDGEYVFEQFPCPFLRENRCTVYEARPQVCRSFPHLHKDEFVFRLINIINNCSFCPIVYNVFERLIEELWHSHGELDEDDGEW